MTKFSNAMKRRVLEAIIAHNDRGCLLGLEELAMITGIELEQVAGCMKWLEERGYVIRPAHPHDGTA